jgi:cyclopropane fatty-acyl-phospholipid synthase-like methyltransferase
VTVHLAAPDETNIGQAWLDAAPYVREKLQVGALHADVGCGAGARLVALARAFPRSRFVGFDSSASRLERAAAAVRAARLTSRVRLQQLRMPRGVPPSFDVVSVLELAAHPGDGAALLRSVHDALAADGAAVVGGTSEPVARDLCLDAGFSFIRRLQVAELELLEVRP